MVFAIILVLYQTCLLQIIYCQITNWDNLYHYEFGARLNEKVGQFYYKLGKVLQIGTILLQIRADITSKGICYKNISRH